MLPPTPLPRPLCLTPVVIALRIRQHLAGIVSRGQLGEWALRQLVGQDQYTALLAALIPCDEAGLTDDEERRMLEQLALRLEA